MDKEIIISAKGLTKTFGSGDSRVTAVNDVSLEVYKGEIVAVTGESGSGKSTLLNLLGGLDKPDSGTVTVDGRELTALKDHQLAAYRRRYSGFVFQFYNLIPVLNVEENLTLPLDLDGRDTDKSRLDELLQLLGLSDRRYNLPAQLSGGQQQRAAIGRAVIAQPPCIFADEPTGNLDTANSREIVDLFKQLAAKYGTTVILVTHDGTVAAEADRVITMRDGSVVSEKVRSI
ncbi:MAG: ABC transporter ATP-binding protein [Ruminococcus sp.]|nr:ABC transporter ATP-binding protein [Ruminococcus sp.]